MAEPGALLRQPRPWPMGRALLWVGMLASVFLLPYAQLSWWGFLPSTASVLLLLHWRYGAEALRRGGLALDLRAGALSLALLVACWMLSRFVLLEQIAAARGLRLEPRPLAEVGRFALQALDEEIVLGALPLFALVRRWRQPRLVAVGLALVFAALHAALYRFGTYRTSLETATLISLVAVGIVRNAAILLTGHVGYAWALHAAWNLVMFSGTWVVEASGDRLVEPQVLDALVGHPAVLVAAGAAALLLLGLPRWRSGLSGPAG